MNSTKIIILNEQQQRQRNEIAEELARQTRLPIARILLTAWIQIDGRHFTTTLGREVILSPDLAEKIDALPRTGRFVFSASPFPPIIPDKYLDGAQRWARRKNRRHLRISFE
jgi:hypothetical protein